MEFQENSPMSQSDFVRELEQLKLRLSSSINEGQFDKLFALISSNIDSAIQKIALQDVFFNFCLVVLRSADHAQFHQLMVLLLDKYSQILRSALTDIWVLLADSADSIFGSLHSYFILFRELQSSVEFSTYSKGVYADCISVLIVCVDFLQTATMAHQSKEVSKVARLLSCLIVILVKGNAIKVRILHDNFQRMLGPGTDPNVHLVLLRDLFHDCSAQICSTFHKMTHRQSQLHNLGADIGKSMKSSGESSHKAAEDGDSSGSEWVGTGEQREAKRMHSPTREETTSDMTTQRMPDSLGLLQLFSIERLKFLCLSLQTLNDELENGLRSVSSFFRPFKSFSSARLKKLISSVFAMISTLHNPLNASQLTKKAMLSIAEQLVLFYPHPKILLEFFRLSMSNGQMMQTICQSLRSLLDQCPFKLGEVLLFPQRKNLIMSSSDPTECSIAESTVATSTLSSPFLASMENTAATFTLDNSYNSLGVTVSCWVRATAKSTTSPSHILSLGNKCVRICAELVSIDSIRISISRLDSSGSSFQLKDFFFKNVFNANAPFVCITLGLRIRDKCMILFAVGSDIKLFEESRLSYAFMKNCVDNVDIAFGAKSSNEFDQSVIFHGIYELSTIFGFKGILPIELVFLLQAVGPACFCFAECHHSPTTLSFSNCFSTKTIVSPLSVHFAHVIQRPQKYLTALRRLLLFTVRPTSAHCYAVYADHNDKSTSEETRTVPIEWRTEIVLNYNTTLDKSFRTIGGVKLFIFLYAMCVDRAYSSATQLEALRLLFRVLRRDSSYYEEWKHPEGDATSKCSTSARFGPYLLVRCLASRTTHLDEQIFQELICFAFSNVLRDNETKLVPTYRSVLLEPEFVQALMSCTDIWKGKCFTFWVHLTQIIANCLSFPTAFAEKESSSECIVEGIQQFNLSQLQMTNFLQDFLFCLLDMLANNRQFQIPLFHGSFSGKKKSDRKQSKAKSAQLAADICRIVHKLIGGFACGYHSGKISELWHFLLLSFPAKDAFLDHSIDPSESRNAWLNDGDDFEQLTLAEHEQLVGDEYKSELSDHLEKLLQKHGRDLINHLWVELKGSVIAMRQKLGKENDIPPSQSNLAEETKSKPSEAICDAHCLLKTTATNQKQKQPNGANETDGADEFRSENDICSEHQQQSQQIGPKEHWLVHVRVRLLRLMCEVILNCDDSSIADLEAKVLNWQTILVLLSKQRVQQLRSLTFILLKNIFLRSSATFRQTFVNSHGFLLLSREMRGTPMNFSIADALFSMTCGEHVLLKDGLDSAHLEKLVFDPFKIGSFSALFSLLEESVEHPTLFWSVCSTLQKIFATESAPRQSMLQLGLVDSMANVLRKICCRSIEPQNDRQCVGEVEMASLFDCWLSFAQSILNSLVPYDDQFSYSLCEELVWLCIIALWKEERRQLMGNFGHRTRSSSGSTDSTSNSSSPDHSKSCVALDQSSTAPSCNPLLRQALCRLLFCWIDSLRSTLSDQYRTPSSFSSLAASVRRQDMQRRLREYSSSAESSDFEMVQNVSQWFPAADSSFGDFLHSHGFHSAASVFSPGFASNEENANRLLFSLTMIRNLFLFFDSPQSAMDDEEVLLRTFLETLLSACCLSPRKANIKVDDWQNILQSASFLRRARYLLLETVAFLLFPAQIKSRKLQERHSSGSQTTLSLMPSKCATANNLHHSSNTLLWSLRRRLIIVCFLAKELRQSREVMTMLMELNLDFQYALKIGLHELCLLPFASSQHVSSAVNEFDTDLDLLVKFMHSINIRSPLANLTLEEIDSLTADEKLLLQQFDEIKSQFLGQMTERAKAAWDRECDLLKFTSDQAITLTCEVAEFQNVPRRVLINWKKELQREWSRANRILAHLVMELCHPEAPLFAPLSWPLGRVLNTTEGPSRERRRFSAAHYSFPLKFLKTERRKAVESVHNAPMPLDNLLNDGDNIQQNHVYGHTDVDDPIRMSISAVILRTAFECAGELAVSDQRLYFLGESAKTTQKGVVHAPVTYSWDYAQIMEMHIRFYQLKDTALELFTSTGDAFLVVFGSEKDRSVLLQQFRTLHLDKLLVDHKTQLRLATQLWRRGTLTNFDYLMILNKLAGRTFNDLMQYPVFPFVLSDYSSGMLDLDNSISYRNLTKPMAIQDSRMEKVYAQIFQSLAEEYSRFSQSGESGTSSHGVFSSVRFGPYHYGSHYSNTGIVAHYLVRVPPYTSVALEYQDNNFDIPDRLFSSLDTTWRLSSSESTTDFKELIPEFFYLYDMLRNGDELELGVRQAGDQVDHVQVPPWCPRGDHRLFCLIHRHALENHHVTANLHYWIDLIFGFKQIGDNAVRALNVFHPATYRGRDFAESSKDDPLIVCAIQTMIRTYGQMPLQLFDSPHLPHFHSSKCQSQQTTPRGQDIITCRPFVSVSANPFLEQFHTVVGIRWGDFVGSPEHDCFYFTTPSRFFTPGTKRSLRLKLVHCDQTTSICYGLPAESTELIVCYRSDRKDPLRLNSELALCAIVSWGFSNFIDNILRIKLVFAGQPHKKRFQPSPTSIDMPQQLWERLIDLQSLQLCLVAYSSATNSLLLGFSCGLIRVYSLHYDQKWHCQLRSSLYAHNCAISSLSISDKFHVILSTSIDAKICLWDANKHNFERRFPLPPPVFSGSVPIEETVTLSCMSSTSADVAVVFQSGMAVSRLALYSINGNLIGLHRERQLTITSIAMTNLAEGTGVNCVAVGLQSGMIRLVEMWTMTVVRDISFHSFQMPIISLLFANESRRLYAAFSNSHVLCWQVPSIYGVGSEEATAANKEWPPCFKVLDPFKCDDSF